jgi:hypothetical protein
MQRLKISLPVLVLGIVLLLMAIIAVYVLEHHYLSCYRYPPGTFHWSWSDCIVP